MMDTTTQVPQPKQLTGLKLWIFRGVAVLFSLALALGLGEAAARILHLAPPCYPESDTAIVLHHTDPNGPIKLTPNWEGYVGGVWTKINEKGFRDRIFTPEPPAGVVRVVVLGDSYTMGDAVEVESTYPKQFETLLAGRHKVEVMNCGVSATNTFNQLETLKDVLRDYHPHLVVLSYNVNDFQWYPETRFERLKKAGFDYTIHDDGRVTTERNYSTLQKGRLWVRNHSYLYRWLANVGDSWTKTDATATDHVKRVQSWIDAGGTTKSSTALGQVKALCDQQGVPLFAIVLPGLLDMPPALSSMDEYPYQKEHELIHEAMKANGIPFADLLPEFAGEDTRKLAAAFPFERHFSPHGNGIVARAMVKELEAKIAEQEKKIAGQ